MIVLGGLHVCMLVGLCDACLTAGMLEACLCMFEVLCVACLEVWSLASLKVGRPTCLEAWRLT